MASKELFSQSLDEIIEGMIAASIPASAIEQKKTQALRIIVKQLSDSIDRNASSASRLSRVLIWLNVLIGVATIAGVIIAASSGAH
jgi:hypothetical protein